MKTLMTALALAMAALTAAPAFATSHKEAPDMKAGASCDSMATDKKLAGAAKNSFLKKCEKDMAGKGMDSPAKADCDGKAADKKLAGAAKNSFVKKCVADAAKPA